MAVLPEAIGPETRTTCFTLGLCNASSLGALLGVSCIQYCDTESGDVRSLWSYQFEVSSPRAVQEFVYFGN